MAYSKQDIAAATGIKPRTILDWTTRGYLIPAVPAEGQGKIPEYDRAGAVQALVLKALSEQGISISKFAEGEKMMEAIHRVIEAIGWRALQGRNPELMITGGGRAVTAAIPQEGKFGGWGLSSNYDVVVCVRLGGMIKSIRKWEDGGGE